MPCRLFMWVLPPPTAQAPACGPESRTEGDVSVSSFPPTAPLALLLHCRLPHRHVRTRALAVSFVEEPASAPLLRVGCSARFNDLQHTCPSIAPNYSFTHGWWGPLVVLWKKLDAFEGMDYLIPTLSTDGTGFIAGPCRLESAL